jgi:diaminopimelate epimerase
MRQEIRYLLADPTGNRTVLVETPVPAGIQSAVAAKLMELEPTAEQAGFLSGSETADIALRMAGGEFCANATMSAAVLFGIRARKAAGIVTVAVSGAPEPVAVEITAKADGLWQGIVQLPRPNAVELVRFADGQTNPVVSFDGISHVILECKMPTAEAEALAKRRCAELSADALGLMFLDRARQTLTPLVYVPGADTLFWENSCGSGTAAVGAFLASETGRAVTVSLKQPGGMLQISASPDGPLRLCGTVRYAYERSAGIEIE